MSTTIKSCTWPEKFSVMLDAQDDSIVIYLTAGDRHEGITVTTADLLAALRAEGVLSADDGLRERIEAVIKDRDARGFHKKATDEIREALNPTPPYVFPTGLGAVVEVAHKDGSTSLFTHTRPLYHSWIRVDSGNPWSEDDIRERFTSIRTLSEGLGLNV